MLYLPVQSSLTGLTETDKKTGKAFLCYVSIPSTEVLGYYQLSLRDRTAERGALI